MAKIPTLVPRGLIRPHVLCVGGGSQLHTELKGRFNQRRVNADFVTSGEALRSVNILQEKSFDFVVMFRDVTLSKQTVETYINTAHETGVRLVWTCSGWHNVYGALYRYGAWGDWPKLGMEDQWAAQARGEIAKVSPYTPPPRRAGGRGDASVTPEGDVGPVGASGPPHAPAPGPEGPMGASEASGPPEGPPEGPEGPEAPVGPVGASGASGGERGRHKPEVLPWDSELVVRAARGAIEAAAAVGCVVRPVEPAAGSPAAFRGFVALASAGISAAMPPDIKAVTLEIGRDGSLMVSYYASDNANSS